MTSLQVVLVLILLILMQEAIRLLTIASDIFVVSTGATVNATISANYTATTDAKNDGTVNLTLGTGGLTVDLTSAAGSKGFNLIGSSGLIPLQLLEKQIHLQLHPLVKET